MSIFETGLFMAFLRPLDRQRAQDLMEQERLDGLVLIQPESIVYATGARPGSAAGWRRAGAVFVIVPADAHLSLTAILGDFYAEEFRTASGIDDIVTFPVWVDLIDIREIHNGQLTERLSAARPSAQVHPRPATFDPRQTFALLADVLARRGLSKARLGTEHAFLPVEDHACFETACPDVRWSNASRLVSRLRMIKHPGEIERLRLAARFAEAGTAATIAHIRPGCTADELFSVFRNAAVGRAAELGFKGTVLANGAITIGPGATGKGRPAERGDVIRLDLGSIVDGYTSDCARTAVLGQPSADQRAIYAALHNAFEVGLEHLCPGIPLREVHGAAMKAMHDRGFDMYCRGHFGHGVGASIFVEEWPFIAAEESIAIETGMVLAYELPWYIRGLGAFMLEDQFVVGAQSVEACWTLPRELAICD
ncbi:M24 family metallopeptidase [Sinorhizobium medicae]|nr:M24 family metallopeptidase [Sinorhizobium meliloti]MDX0482268.1 M24 family metallopeptidase [Sinorhizobium medicae]MDX0351589.1 M24 family metallopeptidase [Sinorhizobium meliloti]MDX1195399.1 M24 family metallopeptidase [Sinorhizobium medicae]MDX1237873.1 M24 family metallopeptidase [Sinorhizobium medicae]